jgi:replication factor A1
MKTIDLIGIIHSVGEKEQINLKNGQKKVRKYVTLVDDTNYSISLTLWGEELCDRNKDRKVGEILAVKSARVSDYGGKSLNVADDHSQIFVDYEHPEAYKLE